MSMQPSPVSYAAVGDPRVDASHLSALAICHYIWAGLLALFACFGFLYILLGVLALTGQMNTVPPAPATATTFPTAANGQQVDAMLGYIFIGMGAFIVVAGWTLAACTLIAGRSIATRRRRTFAIVVAVLNCLIVPIGTTLGVFTLVVLLRESVRQMFETEPQMARR